MESRSVKQDITLCGFVKCVVNKNADYMLVVVHDGRYGELLCSVPSTCTLYYNVEWNKRYHLQARLKGRTKVGGDGKLYTKNLLIIKKAIAE